MMSVQLEMLQAQILGLPVHERARLLDRLIESLDADQALEEAWDAVATQREQELDSGQASRVPLEDVVTRLESRFGV
ncbi:MAG: hypothetical protein EBX65_04410 [Betaproteobacteria bacterium]|nr:hypothetical protein [Betaproteobacteria bacterium]NDA31731.1 hypothetical protein [Betaproteobacteria bacterium]